MDERGDHRQVLTQVEDQPGGERGSQQSLSPAADSCDEQQNKITSSFHQYHRGDGVDGSARVCGAHVARTADSPKDDHNLVYKRLVSDQVENLTTYLC